MQRNAANLQSHLRRWWRGAHHSRRAGVVWAASMVVLLAASGGRPSEPRPAPNRLVWPPPPERTRIIYRHSFSNASDLGWKRGWWRKVVDWLINETDPSLLLQPYALAFDDNWRMIVADIGSHEVKI